MLHLLDDEAPDIRMLPLEVVFSTEVGVIGRLQNDGLHRFSDRVSDPIN